MIEYRLHLWHDLGNAIEAVLNVDAAEGWRFVAALDAGILMERERETEAAELKVSDMAEKVRSGWPGVSKTTVSKPPPGEKP